MKRFLLVAGLVTWAGQADALSCMFGGGGVAFAQAAQNGADFSPAIGTLQWSGLNDLDTYMGRLVMAHEGQEHDVVARFTGDIMGKGGERMPIDQNLRVQTWCANGDCGYAHSEGEMLTFLHNTPGGVVMIATPCQSYPTGADGVTVAEVQQCLDGGPCSAEFKY